MFRRQRHGSQHSIPFRVNSNKYSRKRLSDRLAWLGVDDVRLYLDEIARERMRTTLIGFTGGEPFMNRDIAAMLELVLGRGFDALVLTNAMKPLRRHRAALLALVGWFFAWSTSTASLQFSK